MKCSFFYSFPVCIGICEFILAKSIRSFFSICQKERINLVILGKFSWCARFIYQHTLHNTTTTPLPSLHFCPMPKETTKTKKWGQADRDLLADLTNRRLLDFNYRHHPPK
jgi:hypothetical protein